MAQGTPQFTLGQILEAGQRAEADGRVEYATQFYRHLTDHYPQSAEARIARDGLARLQHRQAGGRPREPESSEPYAPPASGGGYSDAWPDARPDPRPDPRYAENQGRRGPGIPGVNGTSAHSSLGVPPAPSAGGQVHSEGATRSRMQLAPVEYDPDDSLYDEDIPSPRKRYRFGRAIAFVMLLVGIAILAASVIMIIAPFVLPQVNTLGFGPMMLVGAGLVTAFVGIILCLISQVSRAVFEGAEAARYTAEVQSITAATRAASKRH